MRYLVTVSQSGNWPSGPYGADTLSGAKAIAEEFGTTKNLATVERVTKGNVRTHVATFRRDPNGDGTRWYRANY